MADDFARCSCGAAYYAATDRFTHEGKTYILANGEALDRCPACKAAQIEEERAKAAPVTNPPVRVHSTSSEAGAKLREEFLQQERDKAGKKEKE